jgi:recombination protein RecT
MQPLKSVGGARRILEAAGGELEKAVAGRLDPVYVARVALTALEKNPRLYQCTGKSFLAAMLEGAELGLLPGSVLGQAFLVPYGDQCTFQIGYLGLVALARRSGIIEHVLAECVHEHDEFAYRLGTEHFVEHLPAEDEDGNQGEVTYVYAVAILRGAETPAFKVWSRQRIEKHAKKYSKSYRANKAGCPWKTAWEAMAKKTVVRDLLKMLADSPELSRAVLQDEYREAGVTDKAPGSTMTASKFGFGSGPKPVEVEVLDAGAGEQEAETEGPTLAPASGHTDDKGGDA